MHPWLSIWSTGSKPRQPGELNLTFDEAVVKSSSSFDEGKIFFNHLANSKALIGCVQENKLSIIFSQGNKNQTFNKAMQVSDLQFGPRELRPSISGSHPTVDDARTWWESYVGRFLSLQVPISGVRFGEFTKITKHDWTRYWIPHDGF